MVLEYSQQLLVGRREFVKYLMNGGILFFFSLKVLNEGNKRILHRTRFLRPISAKKNIIVTFNSRTIY